MDKHEEYKRSQCCAVCSLQWSGPFGFGHSELAIKASQTGKLPLQQTQILNLVLVEVESWESLSILSKSKSRSTKRLATFTALKAVSQTCYCLVVASIPLTTALSRFIYCTLSNSYITIHYI